MNVDKPTVDGFGYEWSQFDQSSCDPQELHDLFSAYFKIFPWSRLPEKAVGFDIGCGSGRWAPFVAEKVAVLHCIDASEAALVVARRNLQFYPNCHFHLASVDSIPVPDQSMDFGYALGVLHHVPDAQAALMSCVAKLKTGAPFLLYMYYAFDSKPWWFRTIWALSDLVRRLISHSPHSIKYIVSQAIAVLIYFPCARLSRLLELLGFNVSSMPLSFYRNRSLYVMRTDALDRFGTRLERRFTRSEIQLMMEHAGLERITFSDSAPYWCAVGYKRCVA